MEAALWEPTAKQANALRQFTDNGEYYINNINRLRKKYSGKFVAIHNRQVILDSNNADDLLQQLRNRFPELDLHEVCVTYLPKEREVSIA